MTKSTLSHERAIKEGRVAGVNCAHCRATPYEDHKGGCGILGVADMLEQRAAPSSTVPMEPTEAMRAALRAQFKGHDNYAYEEAFWRDWKVVMATLSATAARDCKRADAPTRGRS